MNKTAIQLVFSAPNHQDPRKLSGMRGMGFPRWLYIYTILLEGLSMTLKLPDSAHPNVAKKRKDDYAGSIHDILQCQHDGVSA